MTLDEVVGHIRDWHHARNLIAGSTNQAQLVKLAEEMGELAGAIARGESVQDPIGDMLVVLINIAERERLFLVDCAEAAYTEIKDRRGLMVDGVFVKEEDL